MNSMATLCYFSSVFLSAPMTSFVMGLAGIPLTYCMFAAVNFVVLVVVLAVVPETKGMTYFEYNKEKAKHKESAKEEESGQFLSI